MPDALNVLLANINQIPECNLYGRVTAVQGMLVEVGGVQRRLSVGDRCEIAARGDRKLNCEVVGFRDGHALLMPFGALEGVGLGCKADVIDSMPVVRPTAAWLGRVVNAMGEPIDGKGPLPEGDVIYPLKNNPPPAHARQRVQGKVDLGVRAINTFLSCCRGQRMGIFAGSGVGKSVLLGMIARYTAADVNVIGLIGERGREVQEFISDELGEAGLARSVVVVATSDESPLMRRQAAYMTLSLAEYYRDLGSNVLCMMDSVTRFAMAQREIGLSAGEPPTSKGYTPTVFAELPKLLERAGPGLHGQGNITGLFTVLVDGDDHNEPIADAVRGILDGHIVLERSIAERGRYPAINLLRSLSRAMPGCNTEDENKLVSRARELLSAYEDMAEMIRLGAYRPGSDPKTDEAIRYYPALDGFLKQQRHQRADLDGGYAELAAILQGGAA
ncbi:MAG TPA: flagellar protein export ATPase FliI [Alphaproteobacteria bacterium]|nr:flagellar protein export ATPase FliI [Alphaproteobacteria bacterium]